MPAVPIDYSKGFIYVIRCKDENITYEYVGSTCNFKGRKQDHKKICNGDEKSYKDWNLKIYRTIRENGGWDNWDMIMIEEYPCENKRQLEKREEELRVERISVLNMKKAFQPLSVYEYQKQYRVDNKERSKELSKEYREKNRDKLLIKKKEDWIKNKEKYSEKITCECGSICNKRSLNEHIKTKKHQDFILVN